MKSEFYEEKAKKYNLPDYDKANREFFLEEIENCDSMKKISEKMLEKLQKYGELLEGFLNTDGNSLAVLIETKSINESGREKLSMLYREIIILERSMLICNLEPSDDSYAKFGKECYEKWTKLKPDLLHFVEKLKNAWKEEINVREELGYSG